MSDGGSPVFVGEFERRAWLGPDGASYAHVAGAWSNTYPTADLPKWLDFYERMAAQTRQPRYGEDVKLLRQVEAELRRPVAAGDEGGKVPSGIEDLDRAIAEAREAGLDL